MKQLTKLIAALSPLFATLILSGCSADTEKTTRLLEASGTWDPYLVQYLVPGSDFLSIHGITFDQDDNIYAGSVMGQSIHKIDTLTGESTVFVGPPQGMADDLEFGPDGTLVWTSILTGQVHARRPNGEVFVVAENLPGINSIAFSPSGRLFVTQVLWDDALWELDLSGHKPPRKVIENMGHLNGFDFDKEGYLYGPLLYKGKVVKIDVDSGEMSTLAKGFKIPVAVNLDSNNNLYIADTALGRVVRVDIKTGEKTLVTTVEPGIDNLALNSRNELYITNMNDNALIKINTRTGATHSVVSSKISVPGGLDLIEENGKETLLLGNLFTYTAIDGESGEKTDIKRGLRDDFELPMTVNIQGERVVVTSWFTGGVEILDRNTHQSIAVHHGFLHPVDALQLSDGPLLVAEHGTESIIEVSEDGDRNVLVDKVPGISAMRQGSEEDTFYATDVLNGQLLEIDDDGDIDIIAEGLDRPEGFDIAPDGSIVLAEVGRQRIVHIDPANGKVNEIARNLAIGLAPAQGTPPGYIQTGVAVSSAGNIYVTSDLNTAIYKITPQ